MNRQTYTLIATLLATTAIAAPPESEPMFDLSKDKVLYCVGYAHLDTQWRWDFTTTVDKYIRDTLDHNFERFEQYPEYVFNFTGSVRYQMMKEYYPERYERLKKYIADGRWFVSGSSVDEGDVNVPSAEAIIRQVLYGNDFFRKEFGKDSVDFMLPDCFGFPASLPSIWAHCGLKGFSTQKLTWGSAMGIPFKVGVWEGLDGKSVIAAFDPGAYVGAIDGRVDTNPEWVERVNTNGEKYGVWADYHYYGVGDQGGAPRAKDVANYIASMNNPDSKIKVALVSSDQMYKDITPELKAKLPRYKGDLLLTEHSAGTLTSQSYMKRWNRKNEQLADAAERVAVAADWMGTSKYPREKLLRSWERLLANQMHDILPGTSIPRAYTYSWNDEIVAMNGFAAVLENAVDSIARSLDTQTVGQPLVVYNPLAIRREDVVEATVQFDDPAPKHIRVFDHEGNERPSQIIGRNENEITIIFTANVPPVSLSVFDVRPAEKPFSHGRNSRKKPTITNGRKFREMLVNEHYTIGIDANGDVASIIDKSNGKELLASPAQLVFTHEKPQNWPAWNMDWNDRKNPPIDTVKGPRKIRIVENGPVRVAVEIEREARNSIIKQQIRLATGEAGRRVEFKCNVDWQSAQVALKAAFPLSIVNPNATYNWGMGTIARGNNEPTKYEVPSHEWFDLSDKKGRRGVSILEDSKFGSDKPNDNTLRLTLLYTPGVRKSYMDQHSQDWGRHDFTYAVYAHEGDWRVGQSEWQGRRLNQPLIAFQSPKHKGSLGQAYSIANVSTQQVDIRAIKKAENSEHIIVRVQELFGKSVENVEVSFAADVSEAFEVDGQERRIGTAKMEGGKLRFNLTPYAPKSFAVKLRPPNYPHPALSAQPIELAYNTDVISSDANRSKDGAFSPDGLTIPAEMFPAKLETDNVPFKLGPTADGQSNAVACQGQLVDLPEGDFTHIYFLAAADDDTAAEFVVDEKLHDLKIQSWTGFVGQWDDRIWDTRFGEVDHVCDGKVIGFKTGYIKRAPIAWFATHHHHPTEGNKAYKFSYLFMHRIPISGEAEQLKLPENPAIKVFALTAVKHPQPPVRAAQALYDDFSDRKPIALRHEYPPPPKAVFDGVTAAGTVTLDRAESFGALSMGPPSDADFLSKSKIAFRFFDEPDRQPRSGSGAVDDTLPRLNDGEVAQNDDDTKRCVWFDNPGRFFINLGESKRISRVNTYSWHRHERAPQFFSLWGSVAETMPDPNISHGKHDGWTLIGVVNSKDLGSGGVHGSSVHTQDKAIGPFRYLLWATEDMGNGTFFTEIDVHVAD